MFNIAGIKNLLDVAITGGSGFIGLQLVMKHLHRGDRVRVLTRSNSYPVHGPEIFVGNLSLTDANTIILLNKFTEGVDVLYHCAAEIHDESLMQALHIEGTRRLLEAASGRVGRWVQLSSVGAYGVCRDGVVTEETQEMPSGVYETTKTEADKIIKESGLPFVILRPSNVFGETMTNQSLYQMVDMIQKGFFFYLGKPGAIVNYVHVDDVVYALIQCGTNKRAIGQTYNVSQSTTIEKMVDALMKGMGCKRKVVRLPELPFRLIASLMKHYSGFPLTHSRIDAMTGRCRCDSSKIINEVGFEFRNTLEERFFLFASELRL